MAKAEMSIKILTISEDELRKIIHEEVRKIIEPGAYRQPYLPPVPHPITYPSPQIYCGVANDPTVPNTWTTAKIATN